MTNIIHDIQIWYDEAEANTDPRTRGWFLLGNPIPIVLIVCAYLIIVWVGPKAMKNREPFKLKEVMICYNIIATLMSAYIGLNLIVSAIALRYNLFCQASRPIWTPHEINLVNAMWWYFISKLIEFSDTIFFVLRKKERQITFLHVYHHATVFSFWWFVCKWIPSGSMVFPAALNAGIHVLMYSYYGLSAFGPQMKKYLWWKKYLTLIQLSQFGVELFFGVIAIFIDCAYPLWMILTFDAYIFTFMLLFGHFYYVTYLRDRKLKLENGLPLNSVNIDENGNNNIVNLKANML